MDIRRWLKKSQAKILAIGWRLVLYETYNQLYDKVLYTWAMLYFGVTQGWLLMAAGSLVQCAYMFWRYDRVGVDWLFAKSVRDYETRESLTWFEKTVSRISQSRKGLWGLLAFVLANISLDPLIVAVHFKDSHFKGVTRRDWFVLVASVLIGNLYWGIRIGILVKLLVWAKSLL